MNNDIENTYAVAWFAPNRNFPPRIDVKGPFTESQADNIAWNLRRQTAGASGTYKAIRITQELAQ